MAFVSARCPNCKGEIQLDDSKKSGFCLHCGSKVLVEEAVKTVKLDRSDSVDKYLKLARNADTSSNYEESEKYCNMILEIENENVEIWYLKGKAVGWQTTIANNRLTEMITAFTSGLECIDSKDTDLLAKYSDKMCADIIEICQAIINLVCNNFIEYASESNVNDYANQISNMISCLYPFAIIVSKNTNTEFNVDLINDYAAIKGNVAAVQVWQQALNKFGTNKADQTKYAWETFIEEGDYCIRLLNVAFTLTKDECSARTIVDNYIRINTALIGSCSYTKQYTEYGSYYIPDYSLAANAKQIRINNNNMMTNQLNQKIAEIKANEEKKKREYYEKHTDKLEKDMAEKKKTISEVATKLNENSVKISEIDGRIATYTQKKKSTGFFSFSEKSKINSMIKTEENSKNLLLIENNKLYTQLNEAKTFVEKYKDILEKKEEENSSKKEQPKKGKKEDKK